MSNSSKKVIGIIITILIVGFLLISLVNSEKYSNPLLLGLTLFSIILGYLIKPNKEIIGETPLDPEKQQDTNDKQKEKLPEVEIPEEFRMVQEMFKKSPNSPESNINPQQELNKQEDKKDGR